MKVIGLTCAVWVSCVSGQRHFLLFTVELKAKASLSRELCSPELTSAFSQQARPRLCVSLPRAAQADGPLAPGIFLATEHIQWRNATVPESGAEQRTVIRGSGLGLSHFTLYHDGYKSGAGTLEKGNFFFFFNQRNASERCRRACSLRGVKSPSKGTH
jgi:hypothetical protein